MIFNKDYFEKVFQKDGAWGYETSEYERLKYRRQLEAIQRHCPAPQYILEIGCAEGKYTRMVAEAFPKATIVGVDISHIAVERARQKCSGCPNIDLLEADIVELLVENQLPAHRFDIIIQSECLYYLFPRLLLQMKLVSYLKNLARALSAEGILVTSNGLIGVTRGVMGIYYLMLGRLCNQEYSANFREWNEFRNKYVAYDLKIFRASYRAL